MLVSNNILDAQLQNFPQQTHFPTYQTYLYNRNTLNQDTLAQQMVSAFSPMSKQLLVKQATTKNKHKSPQTNTNNHKPRANNHKPPANGHRL